MGSTSMRGERRSTDLAASLNGRMVVVSRGPRTKPGLLRPNEAGGKSAVGMERIIAFEKEISQPLWKRLASERSRSAFGQAFQIQRFFAKHFTDGFAPNRIF